MQLAAPANYIVVNVANVAFEELLWFFFKAYKPFWFYMNHRLMQKVKNVAYYFSIILYIYIFF